MQSTNPPHHKKRTYNAKIYLCNSPHAYAWLRQKTWRESSGRKIKGRMGGEVERSEVRDITLHLCRTVNHSRKCIRHHRAAVQKKQELKRANLSSCTLVRLATGDSLSPNHCRWKGHVENSPALCKKKKKKEKEREEKQTTSSPSRQVFHPKNDSLSV